MFTVKRLVILGLVIILLLVSIIIFLLVRDIPKEEKAVDAAEAIVVDAVEEEVTELTPMPTIPPEEPPMAEAEITPEPTPTPTPTPTPKPTAKNTSSSDEDEEEDADPYFELSVPKTSIAANETITVGITLINGSSSQYSKAPLVSVGDSTILTASVAGSGDYNISIKGIKAGSTTVTTSMSGVPSKSLTITVSGGTEITAINLVPSTVVLDKGGIVTLRPEFLPVGIYAQSLLYSSSDSNIATVTQSGQVTAGATYGTAIIKATAPNGIFGICNIIVAPPTPTATPSPIVVVTQTPVVTVTPSTAPTT